MKKASFAILILFVGCSGVKLESLKVQKNTYSNFSSFVPQKSRKVSYKPPVLAFEKRDGDRLTITVVDFLHGCSGDSKDYKGTIEVMDKVINLKYRYIGGAYRCIGDYEFTYVLKGLEPGEYQFQFNGKLLTFPDKT